MRSAIMAAMAAAVLGAGAGAGEQPDPAKAKAERIEKVKRQIAKDEAVIRQQTDEILARQEKTHPAVAAIGRQKRDKARAELPSLKTELDWLEGRLTLAACEKSVKDLEASIEKAKPAEKPPIQAALDDARAVLERVKKLEAEKDF